MSLFDGRAQAESHTDPSPEPFRVEERLGNEGTDELVNSSITPMGLERYCNIKSTLVV